MKRIARPLLIGVCLLIALTSACNYPAPTSPPAGTILPNGSIGTSTPATMEIATGTPLTPVIPITGENVVQMQCQFCVNGLTHAVFIFPDFAIFDVESSTPVTCLTAEVVNGKRVLVCHGAQLTSFNLKICSEASNCLLFPVALQACPLVPNTGASALTSTPMTPVFLIPINTLQASDEPKSNPTATSTIPTSTGVPPLSTPTTAPTSTPVPTSIVPTILPTIAPTDVINTLVPTEPPPPTDQPTSTSNDSKKDTKTPNP